MRGEFKPHDHIHVCLQDEHVPELTFTHALHKLVLSTHTPVDSFWSRDFFKIQQVPVEEFRLAVDNAVMHIHRLVTESLDNRGVTNETYEDLLVALGSLRHLRNNMRNCAAIGAVLDAKGTQTYFTADLYFLPFALVENVYLARPE